MERRKDRIWKAAVLIGAVLALSEGCAGEKTNPEVLSDTKEMSHGAAESEAGSHGAGESEAGSHGAGESEAGSHGAAESEEEIYGAAESEAKIHAAAEPEAPSAPSWDTDFDQWAQYRKENDPSEEMLGEVRRFSWDTASELLKDTGKNENYSPISLYYALALGAMGAEGETARQFETLLGFSDREAFADQCGKLYRTLYVSGSRYGDETMSRSNIANSLWLDHQTEFKTAFIDTAAKDFYSSLYTVDFSDKNTGAAMGEWVRDHTGGTIAPEITPVPNQLLSVINTIYFYDEWTTRFDENKTAQDTFYVSEDESVKLPLMFMNQERVGGFEKGENFTRASLGLKECGSMVFVLPDRGTSVDQLLSDGESLRKALTEGRSLYGTITWKIPKFSFGSSYDLKETMERLGLSDAFSEKADFSAMTDVPVWIDQIRQETHIGINENGVEAAAYTELAFAGAGLSEDHAEMILNRPFLYGIMSNEGVPLFIGVYRGTEG